tara:strand:- start:247 stop:531 length:285 start_codon:yes stop_codon:yes gene_type:complete
MILKKRISFLLFIFFILFIAHSFFMSKKNIFFLFGNFSIIDELILKKKKLENKKIELEIFHYNFKHNKEFRKQVLKEELNYKEKGQKIILYNVK